MPRINDQYRICFVWTGNGADEVEIVVDRVGTRVRLQVDEDVDEIDDEFGLTATDVTIEN